MHPEELAREGWEKQTTHNKPRLSKVAEMYKEIGFEVHLEPFHPDKRRKIPCTNY